MLDRDGNRIDRRNPQDIFVPLYNKQIPPGAGQVVHFAPRGARGVDRADHARGQGQLPQVRPQVHGLRLRQGQGPELPVVVMAERRGRSCPSRAARRSTNEPSPIKPAWQRWNDYGIGLLLEGGDKGGQKGELKQAEEVFLKVAELGQGRRLGEPGAGLSEGRAGSPTPSTALEKAAAPQGARRPLGDQLADRPDQRPQRHLDEAIASYEAVLATQIPDGSSTSASTSRSSTTWPRTLRRGPARAGREPRADRMAQEGGRGLSSHPGRSTRENVAAHYGLGLAFGDPAWGDRVSTVRGRRRIDDRPSADGRRPGRAVAGSAAAVADRKATAAARRERSLELRGRSSGSWKGPRPEFQSRLEPLHELVETLGPVWEQETDAAVQAALGACPGGHAQGACTSGSSPTRPPRARRSRSPARTTRRPTMNAQSIVIHSAAPPRRAGDRRGTAPVDSDAKRETTITARPPSQPESTAVQESGE